MDNIVAEKKSEKKSKYDQRYKAAVDAAAAVFAEKSYHGCGTTDIAHKLNIKQGSLYYYFKSKEAALEAVCLMGITEQANFLAELISKELSFAENIKAITQFSLKSLRENGDYIVVFNNDRKSIPLERRGKVREQSHNYHLMLMDIFRTGQEKGEIKAELDILISVRAYTGLLSSASKWYHSEPTIDLAAVLNQFSEMFLNGAIK
nr:TetR/AcrR family transcriptional regulator [Endozoicomonas sp. OPT23]